MPDPPLKFHLPEAILGVDVSEAEERVALGGREDVRDRVRVAHDFDRSRESLDVNGAARPRQRAAGVEIRAGGGRCYDDDENADGDQ